jgi:hypothetical protein
VVIRCVEVEDGVPPAESPWSEPNKGPKRYKHLCTDSALDTKRGSSTALSSTWPGEISWSFSDFQGKEAVFA